MRLPTGEWMDLPIASHQATEAYLTGANTDWGSERLLAEMDLGDGAFLDVGANIGFYSLYLAPLAAAVYSFEPDPRVQPVLRKNVAKSPKIEVVPCAAGAAPGRARFVMEDCCEVSHLADEGPAGKHEIEVEVTTIDSFVARRHLHVSAIKIDAEGHDLEVVEGALGVMAEQHPIVLTEALPSVDLFKMAQTVGYRVFAYVRDPRTLLKSFCELRPGVPLHGDTKMLFLAPANRVDALVHCSRLPTRSKKALAVRRAVPGTYA